MSPPAPPKPAQRHDIAPLPGPTAPPLIPLHRFGRDNELEDLAHEPDDHQRSTHVSPSHSILPASLSAVYATPYYGRRLSDPLQPNHRGCSGVSAVLPL